MKLRIKSKSYLYAKYIAREDWHKTTNFNRIGFETLHRENLPAYIYIDKTQVTIQWYTFGKNIKHQHSH